MPRRLLTWTSMFLVLSLLNLVNSSQSVLGDASLDENTNRGEHYRVCPLPRCKGCPSEEEITAPGIGFALETSYGAAVARLHDGTYKQIALIEGDASYTDLLRRLATGPRDRSPDRDVSDWASLLQYLKLLAQRRLNKLTGRPATPETAILATMVSALYKETQTWLGTEQHIAAAVLSSPDLIRLTNDETNDVFDYLEIRNLMSGQGSLEATSAAYAGYGLGLCTTYTDVGSCERESWKFPYQRVLHIDFNRESLSGTIKSPYTAQDMSVMDAGFIDPDLGHGREEARLALTPDGEGKLYWTAVSSRIRELVVSFKPRITVLLLTGTSATDASFKAAVRDALHDIVGEDVLAVLNNEGGDDINEEEWRAQLEFATARGAAEIAKRMQEGPVGCADSDECRKRREGQRPALVHISDTDDVQEL